MALWWSLYSLFLRHVTMIPAKSNVREEIFILVQSFRGLQSIVEGEKGKIAQSMAVGACGKDCSHRREPESKE